MLEQVPGDRAVPELVEAGGEAGQGGFEVFADLAVEGGAFADEVAALADEQLQGGPGFVAGGFEEGAAGDGGAVDGGQVGVVGLVAGIDGLAILLGDEGMEDARLEAGGGEGALDEAVIAAGAFDGDEAVAELVLGEGVADLGDGGVEVGTVVGDGGGWDEDAAVEVGEEELGAGLGTVEADDAEVFGTDLLDAWMEHAARLADAVRSDDVTDGRLRVRVVAMRPASENRERAHPILAAGRSGEGYFSVKPTYQGSSHCDSWRVGEGYFFSKTHIPGLIPL